MIIALQFLVNGVATDATSAVLSDPTATFGVRRIDTDAIIVAAGTAMTHDGTGSYSYTFAEPAAGLTYEYWPELVYLGKTYRVQKFSQGSAGGSVVISTSTSGQLRLSSARKHIRMFSRNAGDSTFYPTYMLDFAFQRAANELIREAHLCLRTDSIDTIADQQAYAITPTTFRAERVDSVYLTGDNVQVRMDQQYPVLREWLYARGAPLDCYGDRYKTARLAIVDYTDLNDYAIANPTTGQPVMIAFKPDGTYALYPTPDQVYTVNRRWSDFFTTWWWGTPTTTFTNTAGVLSAVVVTDGSDNQSALAATWSDAGGGTGATGTATVVNGSLTGVSVGGGGGSGYSAATALLLNGYDSTDIGFNLPDDLLFEVLSLGVPAFLQFNQPEAAFATEKGQEFRAYIEKVKGQIGGLGVKRIIRRG